MQSKKPTLLLITLLLIPIIHAEEERCGITNLATCIPEKIFSFTLNKVNAVLQPFLTITKELLSAPVNIDSFISLWAIIIYIISIFYGIFILIAGFNLMISGYSAEKREMAKQWLKNIFLMMILVQASFYLYSLILEMSSSLTAGVINMIDENFFLLTADNFIELGIQLVLGIIYMIVLILTMILLSLRYLLVAVGVVFFPIGLFLNFIPPLKPYGKLIINSLLTMIFITFIQALILLSASKLIEISVFTDWKTVIMIASFTFMDLVMLLLIIFALTKSAMSAYNSDSAKAIKVINSNTPSNQYNDPGRFQGVKYQWRYY